MGIGSNGNLNVTIEPVAYQIDELLREDGFSPFADWFHRLEINAAVKVQVALRRIEQGKHLTAEARWH